MARDGDLRILLREHLRDGDWVSIETGLTAGGVPDSNYCFPGGREGWVEGKVTHGWKVTLRPAQVGWLARRSRKGGRCFVLVRRLARGEDELYLIRGSDAEDFSRGGSTLLGFSRTAGRWAGGPAKWNWAELRQILMA